jgi:hypothetical protein
MKTEQDVDECDFSSKVSRGLLQLEARVRCLSVLVEE